MNRESSTIANRRQFLQRAGGGFGLIGLAALLQEEGLLGSTARAADGLGDQALNPMAPRPSHFPAKAKRVIWIFVNGGPSQVDTWDYKPALAKWDGKSMREFDPTFKDTTGFFKNQVGGLMKSPFAFTPRGQSRQDGLRAVPEPRRTRRQDGLHPLGLHRVEQPLARALHDEHRAAPDGVPLRRLVGDLWPGEREPGPARVRRHERPEGPRPPQRAGRQLGRGVPAGGLPGDAPAAQGAADRQPRTPRRR